MIKNFDALTPYEPSFIPKTKKDQKVEKTRYLLMGGEFHFSFASKASSGGVEASRVSAGSRMGAFSNEFLETRLPLKAAWGGRISNGMPSVV